MSEQEENQVAISRRAPGVPFASPQCAQICAALALAQGKFTNPKRSKTATVRPRDGGQGYSFSYAPLDEVIDAIKTGLAENALSRQQYLIRGDGGYFVRTVIWHSSGEWLASDYPVITTKEGPQAFAGAVTYARRYGLSLALGLAPEDDDGESAGNTVVSIKPNNARPDAVIAASGADAPVETVAGARGQLANGEQYDSETGEVVEDHEQREADMWRYDTKLGEAAERGTQALEVAWLALPKGRGLQQQLKAALERRHKVKAREVDGQAR